MKWLKENIHTIEKGSAIRRSLSDFLRLLSLFSVCKDICKRSGNGTALAPIAHLTVFPSGCAAATGPLFALLAGCAGLALGFGKKCLDGKIHLLLFNVECNYLCIYFVAYVKHACGSFYSIVAYLRYVNETVDAFFNLNECTEGYEPYNLAVNNVADCILFGCKVPGLGLKLLITYGNLLVLFVNFENEEVVSFAYLQNIGNVLNTRPGEVGDVCKAVETVYGNERAEGGYPSTLPSTVSPT